MRGSYEGQYQKNLRGPDEAHVLLQGVSLLNVYNVPGEGPPFYGKSHVRGFASVNSSR